MKKILIIGASTGIGRALLEEKLKNSLVYSISRTPPDASHSNLIHHSADILKDPLPDIEQIDSLIYTARARSALSLSRVCMLMISEMILK